MFLKVIGPVCVIISSALVLRGKSANAKPERTLKIAQTRKLLRTLKKQRIPSPFIASKGRGTSSLCAASLYYLPQVAQLIHLPQCRSGNKRHSYCCRMGLIALDTAWPISLEK
jgi:hypothetical protein